MKQEEFETNLFIYPRGDWRCWICFEEDLNLERFAETEKEICLICDSCFRRNLIMLREGLAEL